MPRSFRLMASALLLLPGLLAAQRPLQLLYTTGSTDGAVLPDVRAAAITDRALFVLSRPAPAVHVRYNSGKVLEWGRGGQGPAELADPIDMSWSGSGGLVLDMGNRRLTSFSETGRMSWSRTLGGTYANRVAVMGGDTLIQTLVPMSSERAIVRWRDGLSDTLLAFVSTKNEVRLSPPNATSLTVTRPFAGEAKWSPVVGRGIALWKAGDQTIEIYDLRGKRTAGIPVPASQFEVRPADREWWLSAAIPQEFLGRRVFEPARKLARETLEFPRYFPKLTGLIGGADGSLWICRTSPGSGEVWEEVTRLGKAGRSFRLLPGQQLLQLGNGVAAVRGIGEDDESLVSVYRLP